MTICYQCTHGHKNDGICFLCFNDSKFEKQEITVKMKGEPMTPDFIPEWFDKWFFALFPKSKPVLKPMEVAYTLHIPKDRVYRAMNYGELDSIKTGGRWIIPRPGLKQWLLERYTLNLD